MPEQKAFKSRLIKIAITIIVILVICTFLSRTVETLMLPLVEVAGAADSSFVTTISVKGTVNYEKKNAISFDFPVKILKVNVKEKQWALAGDALFEVDAEEFMLELEKKQLAVAEAENAVYDGRWSSQRIRDLLERKLDIAEHEQKLFEEQYPLDGKIRVKKSSLVSRLTVKEGELIPAGTMLAEVCSVDEPMYAEFLLPEQDAKVMSSGGNAVIQYEINGDKNSQDIYMPPQALDENQEGYVFQLNMENVPLQDGQRVDIALKKNILLEDLGGAFVVPKSAVEGLESDLKMYILRKRDGIFGEEDYVEEITITKVDENAVSIVVKSPSLTQETKIIVHTDKSLQPGGTVRVMQ